MDGTGRIAIGGLSKPARLGFPLVRFGRCSGSLMSASVPAPRFGSSRTLTSRTCEPRSRTFAGWSAF